jgi:hypothetical protein
MDRDGVALQGFAYGEDFDPRQGRSLGYRLLAPAEPAAWRDEVEALARRLQAAPYPESWPPAELFCSVLVADGRRLIAAARYGLADHTPQRRRGGLELIGVVGPPNLGVPSALALYQWLRQRRATTENLRTLGGQHRLADVLAAVPAAPLPADPVPVLPIRIWQEGVLLFAATVPSDADHHLRLLEQGTADNWQWLPLVGADFPLQTYAKRGPVIAWAPHLAGVAVKLDQPAPDRTGPPASWRRYAAGVAALTLFLVLGANLWGLHALSQQLHDVGRQKERDVSRAMPAEPANDLSADRFAQALHRLLDKQGAVVVHDPKTKDPVFERLAAADKDLRLGGHQGREVTVSLQALVRRSPSQVEATVRQALEGKGYDPQLVDLVCRRVRELVSGDSK